MTQIVITVDLTPATAEIIKMLADIESQEAIKRSLDIECRALDAQTSEKPIQRSPEDIKPSVPDKKDKRVKPMAAKTEQPQAADEKVLSLTDVRAAALKLSKVGKQTELKEIFAKYDAAMLSDVAESDYPALMKDLEAANA